MTRETKISLLVGLAFIIVIGILLSDHFRATQELPAAVLTNIGDAVRRATDSPGGASPPINFVTPSETSPNQPVATHDELEKSPPPVVASHDYSAQANSTPEASNLIPPPAPEDHGADAPAPEKSLSDVAAQNGEPIVPAQVDGRNAPNIESSQASVPAGPKEYRAESGDSVSRMAAKFMGSNTPENRQAIINANPSLQDDPDMVIVGKAYVIPGTADNNGSSEVAVVNPSNSTTGRYFYTVKEGDSLWRIANDQLGDPSDVDAIKSLNESVLKGDDHDVVIPGMKLQLPAKPVAASNN